MIEQPEITGASLRFPLRSLIDSLDLVAEFFREQGASKDHFQSRLNAYRRLLCEYLSNGAVEVSPEEWVKLGSAIVDITEFVSIATSKVVWLGTSEERTKLLTVQKGSVWPVRGRHDKAREHAFQISVAALIAGNHETEWCGLEWPADVVAVARRERLMIECKRPTSIQSVGRCVRESYAWFSRRTLSLSRHRSAIAIDLSAAVDLGHRLLKFESDRAANAWAHQQIKRSIATTFPSESAMVGERYETSSVPVTFCRLVFPYTTNGRDVVASAVWGVARNGQPSSEDIEFFRRMARTESPVFSLRSSISAILGRS